MAVKICPNGHHYNSDINTSCPFCAAEGIQEPVGYPPTVGYPPIDGHDTRPFDRPGQENGGTMIDIATESGQQPVIGWLVCIEGPDKGKDFCISGAKNPIGRGSGSAVLLSDDRVSREGFPAVIIYDNRKTHQFYLASGDAIAHSLVELNDSVLLGDSVLNPYDRIRVESTVLVFVPFCGTEFHWDL